MESTFVTHAASALFVIPLLSFILPKYKTIKTKKNYVKRGKVIVTLQYHLCPWYRNKCVVSISYICILISIHLSSKFRWTLMFYKNEVLKGSNILIINVLIISLYFVDEEESRSIFCVNDDQKTNLFNLEIVSLFLWGIRDCTAIIFYFSILPRDFTYKCHYESTDDADHIKSIASKCSFK